MSFASLFLTHFDLWECLKKFWWVGWGGGVVSCLNKVSSPGPDFAKVKLGLISLVTRLARFGQFLTGLARSRTRWVGQGQGQELDNYVINVVQNYKIMLQKE